MIVLVETELWPNLLAEAERRRVPVVIVNGRLAPERVGRYQRLAGLYGPLLRSVRSIGAAGTDEAARFRALGVAEDAVRVVGNLKFDLPAPVESPLDLRARFGLADDRPVVAAGSTADGEDRLVLDAFAAARREVPSLILLLAPRHPERFDAASQEAARRGFVVSRASQGPATESTDVLVLDTIGELASLYSVTSSAFVGGSLVPVGGHNLLEPIAAGVPVLYGPHTDHITEIATALEHSGAGVRVASAEALGRSFANLALNSDERERRVMLGQHFMDANRGALHRAAEFVQIQWLGQVVMGAARALQRLHLLMHLQRAAHDDDRNERQQFLELGKKVETQLPLREDVVENEQIWRTLRNLRELIDH